ncbi:hypothetical protein CK203_069073 [Vitis vinifera]|uniref:Uncharacterized protein n=1 Tax=Vitis vinifera TaxID=29760 RepID=A0A438F0V9_VITVI|nr:hypothetical protein CK203_069073 [Vitis vinifera]
MDSAHRRANYMDKIKINGVRLTEEREIKEGVANAFQQQFFRKLGWRADIGSLHFNQTCLQEAEMLELPFTEGEVKAALMDMNGDKAPGPYGFSLFFWQSCWDFVKEEILGDVQGEGAEDLGDFRPISLLGGLYKLLAKVLANRLKKVIGKVVSLDQNTFVTGRQILDASLIANEVIDAWNKRGEKWVNLHGEWSPSWFLLQFKGVASRGPSVPLSFCHGDGSVERSNQKGYGRGFILRCKIQRGRGRAVHVAHLLFADDTIVFCEAKKEYLTNLNWILFWFEAASGLRINLAKSEIIPIGEVEEVDELAVELGCRVG